LIISRYAAYIKNVGYNSLEKQNVEIISTKQFESNYFKYVRNLQLCFLIHILIKLNNRYSKVKRKLKKEHKQKMKNNPFLQVKNEKSKNILDN